MRELRREIQFPGLEAYPTFTFSAAQPAANSKSCPAPNFTALRTLAFYYQVMGFLAGVATCLLCLIQLIVIARRETTIFWGLAGLGGIVIAGLLPRWAYSQFPNILS